MMSRLVSERNLRDRPLRTFLVSLFLLAALVGTFVFLYYRNASVKSRVDETLLRTMGDPAVMSHQLVCIRMRRYPAPCTSLYRLPIKSHEPGILDPERCYAN